MIPHRTIERSIGTLLVVVFSALEPVAEQQPTFKSESELVAINVVVTDKQGRTLLKSLTEDAFEVSEDGRPQRISQFSKDPLPLSIVVALDTSSSMRGDRFRYAREAIGRLVNQLDSHDQIAIYGFNNWPYPITSWTSSHSAVLTALGDAQPMARGGFTSLFEAVRVGLSEFDSGAARRRALIVISDGNEELPGDQWLPGGISSHAVFRRLNLSARDRLPKYVEVVRGSEGLVYAVGISDPGGRGEPLDEGTLKALADPTGGFVTTVDANADIPRGVDRVLNDLRAQYLIGFVPTYPADGKFHKLQVTVRGCDCHARARAGYVHSR